MPFLILSHSDNYKMDELIAIIKNSSEFLIGFCQSDKNLQEEALRFDEIHSNLFRIFESELFHTGNQITGKCCVKALSSYYISLVHKIKSWNDGICKTRREKIEIFLEKLEKITENLEDALQVDANDLCSLSEDHEQYIALRAITTTVKFGDTSELNKEIEKYCKILKILKAVIYRYMQYKKSISRDLMTGWLIIYYSLFSKKAKRSARLFDRFIIYSELSGLCHLLESKLMKKLLPYTFEKILVNEVIFLPKLFPEVTTNNLEALEKNPEFLLSYIKDYVPVRVLSKFQIPKLKSKEPGSTVCEKLIIHVHGGGFISMSSFSHQLYLRSWANRLSVPVFSIDYRLAPDFPFPAALDDIWQAYTWIVNHAESSLNIIPNKIIVVGDSAGGNLTSALALKASIYD